MAPPDTTWLVHRADRIAFGVRGDLELSVETVAALHQFHMAKMREAIEAGQGSSAHRHRVMAKAFEAAVAAHARWAVRGLASFNEYRGAA